MLHTHSRDGIRIIKMRRDPANALDMDLCHALATALHDAGRDAGDRALVLTGTGGVFSAGVDLFRLLEGGEAYVRPFLDALDGLFAAAGGFAKPLVAAINGHAIAGGAVLAFACDVRIMATGPGTLGVPELRVGVPFPRRALDTVRSAVPGRHLREAVLGGHIYSAEEAERKGLVDELAGPQELLDRATEIAGDLGRIPARSYALTKRCLAIPPNGAEAAAIDGEIAAVWQAEETRAHIRAYVERMLGKSSR